MQHADLVPAVAGIPVPRHVPGTRGVHRLAERDAGADPRRHRRPHRGRLPPVRRPRRGDRASASLRGGRLRPGRVRAAGRAPTGSRRGDSSALRPRGHPGVRPRPDAPEHAHANRRDGAPVVTTVERAQTDGNAGNGLVLGLERVSVHFGGIAALTDVHLAVDAGDVCGLIGPNGAGKTTLFDVVSGVRIPDTGRVMLDGSEITRWPAARRARGGLRRTFQRVQTYGWLSIEDNVLAALEWRGGGGGLPADLLGSPIRRRRERERRERVAHVLELCGLTAVARQPAGSLPMGLARMVELARAIVDPPRVLLLDEPTSGLGEGEMERLGERVRAIQAEEACAVLLVEHDVGFVMERCDRIVVLNLGEVIAVGTPKEIQADAGVRTAYLGEQ